MQNSTLRVRLFEAPRHTDALLAFACLSNVLNARQRLALIQVAILHNTALLTAKEGVL